MEKINLNSEQIFYKCSGKDCEGVPKWLHKGLDICLCEECFNNCGMEKRNFTKYKYYDDDEWI